MVFRFITSHPFFAFFVALGAAIRWDNVLDSTKVSRRSSSCAFFFLFFSSSSDTAMVSKCRPVKALHVLASSAADRGCSDTIAGRKWAKKGFITSTDAQQMATFISTDEKIMA